MVTISVLAMATDAESHVTERALLGGRLITTAICRYERATVAGALVQ